jgi:PhnB protein
MNLSTPRLEPYLFFNGTCAEALQFYQSALGAQVEITLRFKDSPEPHPPGRMPEGWENKVMHASFLVGDSRVMASDGCSDAAGFHGFSLAVSFPTEAEAQRAFAALSNGGKVHMPLGRTFWSPCFGMVTDRFGVDWMVTVLPSAGQ